MRGHEKEGYRLNWSPLQSGMLVSGAEDGKACLWDVNTCAMIGGGKKTLEPVMVFLGHTDVVEDVAWHCRDEHLFGSVCDDRK